MIVKHFAARGGVVAIAAAYDTKGKRDASQAFVPEAKAFAHYWQTDGYDARFVPLDNRHARTARRAETIMALLPPLRHVALFGHGWRSGIQHGFGLRDLPALARHLRYAALDDALVVTLYCCSTAQGAAGGDGGFADTLRDALCLEGITHCRVDAHETRGHTTRNPNVRRFEGQGSVYGGQGGGYLVRPRGPLWGAWKAALQDREDPLRYRMSRLSVAEIHGILGANAGGRLPSFP